MSLLFEYGDDRRKRYAPKVKTGCLTCRQRKIKCDEGKPICHRCVVGRRKCTFPFIYNRSLPGLPLPPSNSAVVSTPPAFQKLSGSLEIREVIEMIPMLALNKEYSVPGVNWSDFMLSYCQRVRIYLYDLPSRTGHDELLDSTITCVSSGLKWLLSGSERPAEMDSKSLALYGEALRRLQQALDDPVESKSAHTLCATQLLFLFESLSQDRVRASISHAGGASRLIQHRGVDEFNSTFEKALLAAHAPIALAECLTSGTRYHGEEEAWQNIMLSNLGPASNLSTMDQGVLAHTTICCHWPGLVNDCKQVLVYERDNLELREAVRDKIMACRNKLRQWFETWGVLLFQPVGIDGSRLTRINPGEDRELGKRLDTYALNRMCTIFMSRLYIALGGSFPLAMEEMAKDVAREILEGYNGKDIISHGVRVNAAQAGSVRLALGGAISFLETHDVWQQFAEQNDLRERNGQLLKLIDYSILAKLLKLMRIGQPDRASWGQL